MFNVTSWYFVLSSFKSFILHTRKFLLLILHITAIKSVIVGNLYSTFLLQWFITSPYLKVAVLKMLRNLLAKFLATKLQLIILDASNLSELFFENFRELERNSALNLMPLCISHKPCIPQRYYVVVTLFHNFDARSLTHRWCNIVIPT